MRHYVVPDGSVKDLLEKMDELPIPKQGLEDIEPEEFVDRLKRQHLLDIAGQKRIAAKILEANPVSNAPKRKKVKRR